MDEYKRKSRADLRLCAAMIGCSAVTAMAAIGLMVVQEHDGAAAAKTGPMAAMRQVRRPRRLMRWPLAWSSPS